MGDHNAVDNAQEFHCNIRKDYGLLTPAHTLIYPGCIPVNEDQYYEGVIIDDRAGINIFPRIILSLWATTRMRSRLMIRHMKKLDSNVVWVRLSGKLVYKLFGVVNWMVRKVVAPRYKLAGIAGLLLSFAIRGIFTTGVLAMLAGQLA